jgi:DNA repair protein RecO (recombination protein O)
MQQRTEGIVLRSFPYLEADLLVTYLTPDLGVRKAFAKSARKVKSRFGSSLEPLTHARVTFMGKEDAELPRLTQSDIIHSHQGLRERLSCFALASEMAEATLGLMPPKKVSADVFALMLDMLGRMEADCNALNALLFKIRLLLLKGYAPRLGGCARCGGTSTRFYVSQGAVICEQCRPGVDKGRGGIIGISAGSVKLYESLSTWDLEKTSRIKPSEAILSEVKGLVDAHLEYILSRPLRSREFAVKVS